MSRNGSTDAAAGAHRYPLLTLLHIPVTAATWT